MGAMFVSGFIVTLTVLVMLARMNIRRWLGYASILDVSFTVFLVWIFHGTFSGVVSAAASGLTMTIMLCVLCKLLGVERLSMRRVPVRKGAVRVYWRRYEPTELSWFGVLK
jgi:hypothetical protein